MYAAPPAPNREAGILPAMLLTSSPLPGWPDAHPLGSVPIREAAGLLLRGGLEVRLEVDEREVLWRKAARLSVLAAATSASNRTVGSLRDDPGWRDRLKAAIGEACAIAAADGVPLAADAQWRIIGDLDGDLTTSTARDVAAGKCDLGIGNTYYWALMNDKESDKKAWADATKVILPTFVGGGTHVNLSGVVLARHAPNKANALKLAEWLLGDKAQQMYADLNYEYPVRPGIAINPTIAGYGPLHADPMPISQIAEHKKIPMLDIGTIAASANPNSVPVTVISSGTIFSSMSMRLAANIHESKSTCAANCANNTHVGGTTGMLTWPCTSAKRTTSHQ